MSPIRWSFATALLLISCIDTVTSQKVVSMPFARRQDARTIVKRNTIDLTLGNGQQTSTGLGIYFANVSIGTPGQPVQLQLDTGSSDLWVFSQQGCQNDDIQCFGGVYDSTKSSSYKLLSSGQFNISYVTPGSGVHGNYFSDDVSVGGVTINGLTMGLALAANEVPTGIMGIGYTQDEAIFAQTGGRTSYPNIVSLMVNQSKINTRAYSLYLDDLEEATGQILFGGYDTEKFQGDLALLDIQPDENGIVSSFIVTWTGFSVSTPQGDQLTTNPFTAPVVLDSGTTLTILPSEIAGPLIEGVGASYDKNLDSFLLLCNASSTSATLNYQFGGQSGPTIKVAFSELVLPITDNNGNPLLDTDGQAVCAFGIQPGNDGDLLLFGDTFLRSAYVVYDLDGKTIGLAQAITKSTKSNIVEINGPISNGIQASSVSGQPTVRVTATSQNVPTSGLSTLTGSGSPIFTLGSSSSGSSSSATLTPHSAGSPVPTFDWSSFVIVIGTMFMTLLGGSIFILL